jgi:hypothetical protein
LSSLRRRELKDRFSPGALPSPMTVMSLPVTNARSWKSLYLLGGAAALYRREVRGQQMDKRCGSARLSEMGSTGVTDEKD